MLNKREHLYGLVLQKNNKSFFLLHMMKSAANLAKAEKFGKEFDLI